MKSGHSAGYLPGLDGLRAGSVSLVGIGHFGFDLIPGGLGVTVFFFLSGYLITRLLLAEHAKHQAVDLPRFYGRRFLRLAPELLAFLLFAALLAPLIFDTPATVRQILAGLFHWANYWKIFYITECEGCVSTGHLWSLAVEEHFYFLMPISVVLCGFRLRRLTALFVGVIIFSLVWRCGAVFLAGAGDPYTNVSTESRIDSLAWGCLAAVLQARNSAPIRWIERRPLTLFAAGAILLMGTLIVRDEAFRETLRYSLQGLALFCLVVPLVVTARFGALVRLLEWWPLRWMGRASYGAYLWHYVALATASALLIDGAWLPPEDASLADRFLFAGVAYVAMWVFAAISYLLIYLPFQRFKPLMQPRRQTDAAPIHAHAAH